MRDRALLTSPERDVASVIIRWHKENRREFPWRDNREPYHVLVAEFFLQRTPANRVAALLPKFIEEFASPEKLALAKPHYLTRVYGSLGLKKRMSWLVESMKLVCQKYGGRIPDRFRELITLPGVGEYTASAVLCFGFGHDVPVVDSNVVRIFTRVFGLPETHRTGSTALREIARRLIPKGRGVAYNEALLDFAALVCKKNPVCHSCPIMGSCSYHRSKTRQK